MTIPTVGIHRGMPAEEYHRWKAASNSRLGRLLRSPAHLQVAVEDTANLRVGRAVHSAVLEPDLFASEFIYPDQCAETTKKGDRCSKNGAVCVGGAWFCGIHAPAGAAQDARTVISYGDYQVCLAVRDAVRRHPIVRDLLGQVGDNELSAVWDHAEAGVRCKLRADKVCADLGIVLDLKTTKDASLDAFTRSIYNFGYHRQGAFYSDGLAAHSVEVGHFLFIAVEKEPPYGVAVYRLSDEALRAGRDQLRPLLATYRHCEETGEWPGYPEHIQDIGLPRWAWSQLETEEVG